MRRTRLTVLALACGCTTKGTTSPIETVDSAPTTVVSADVVAEVEATMDPSVDPCADFYAYACGGWMASTELGADAPLTSRPLEHVNEVMDGLRDLVTETSSPSEPLGHYYAECMDEAAIEAAAPEAIATLLELVGDGETPAELARAVARIQLAGASPLMGLYGSGDATRSGYWAAYVYQGGLGLPSASMYAVTEDESAAQVLLAYQALVTQTLTLAGLPRPEAHGRRIVEFERRLAEIAVPPAELRKPPVKVTTDTLATAAPGFDWAAWLDALGFAELPYVLEVPEGYLARLAAVIADTRPAVLRAYLQWTVLQEYARALGPAIGEAHFAFFQTRLRGVKQRSPRWKSCVDWATQALPDEIDRRWVVDHLSESSQHAVEAIVERIHGRLAQRLEATPWLDAPTRAEAMAKVQTLGSKIGRPARWPDPAPVVEEGFAASELRTHRVETRKVLAMVGHPVDPRHWRVAAVTVGAFYDPQANELLAPAGILQPPYYDPRWPMATAYGAIGTVMGHEMTHGFDMRGRTLDAKGETRDWWTDASEARYMERAQCVEDSYSALEVLPGLALSGPQVLSEAIADMGGVSLSFDAYEDWAHESGEDPSAPFGEHLDHRQAFFVAHAQQQCTKSTPEHARTQASRDSHAPSRLRVNTTLAHTPAFWEAFGCEPRTAMHPADACEVW